MITFERSRWLRRYGFHRQLYVTKLDVIWEVNIVVPQLAITAEVLKSTEEVVGKRIAGLDLIGALTNAIKRLNEC